MQRFAVLLVLVVIVVPAFGEDTASLFRVQRLTDRVLVFTELSPWESNHVVIVGAEGLVLVDSGHSALMGRLIRQAVSRELGRDRFAYVIDTHGHWGHTWGDAAFPEALAIGHERAADEMGANLANVEQTLEAIRRRLDQLDARLASLDPADEEAREVRMQRDHFDNIVKGLSETGFEVRTPQLTFSDRLSLDLGDITLKMFYLGPAHSNSDILVLVPEEKVLLMGCFFLEQGPLPVFGAQAVLDPDRWLEVLDAALDDANDIQHVVLGQHTIWPRERLVAMRDYIAHLWSRIQELDAEGVNFETAMTRLPVPAELGFLRDNGAIEEQIVRYQRLEAAALWRQVKESAAAAVELEPFVNVDMDISGLVPAGWEDQGNGVYWREASSLDATVLIAQGAEVSADELLGLYVDAMELDDPLESVGERKANGMTWTLYAVEFQGQPTDIALTEQYGQALIVLLMSEPGEREMMLESVFFPVVDALVPLAQPAA